MKMMQPSMLTIMTVDQRQPLCYSDGSCDIGHKV